MRSAEAELHLEINVSASELSINALVETLDRLEGELFRQAELDDPRPLRAWDVALWSGVTPQGSIKCMERIQETGLVSLLPPDRPWRAVRYLLEPRHPLASSLDRLFRSERALARRPRLFT